VVGSEEWGRGLERWGRGVGNEGWRSKIQVEPATPAAPEHLKRYCSVDCSARNANSVSSLLNSLALRRAYSTLLLSAARIALTSSESTLHAKSTASFPRRTGNGTADARGGTAGARKDGTVGA
jgi:hypothetical protein